MVWNKEVRVSTMHYKNGKTKLTPKTKVPMEETNLPKSKDYNFFVRGTGQDATKGKNLVLNKQKCIHNIFGLKGQLLSNYFLK
ncbi:hypothetical protein [Companilactobacillus futsaii]|nr:hypothetical protein [Companilactobacillus futsaii]